MNHSQNKQNRLEQFIQENKTALKGQFTPPKGLWDKIEAELDGEEESEIKEIPVRKIKKESKVITIRYSTLRIAAVILILVGSTWGVWKLASQQGQGVRTEDAFALDLKQINPELAEAESYYTALISQKRKEIENYSLDDPELSAIFKNDLKELNEMYEQLKDELKGTPTQEQIMDAMIQNLQMRINVLNRQLEILKKLQSQDTNTQNNETNI